MRPLVVLVVAALLAGCSVGKPLKVGESDHVVYQPDSAEKTYGNCQSKEGCARVTLRWLSVVAAPTLAVRESIETFTEGTRLLAYDSDSLFNDEEGVMMEFINDYRSFALSHPDVAMPWHFERRLEHLSDTLGVTSLALTEQRYTGGAHENSTTFFTNFEIRTGRHLTWSDLLLERARPRLDSIGEMAFRRVRKLDAHEDLGSAGFMFEGNRFHLNENFAVTTAGLLFFFNDYEIGPHAMGSTEFTLPWSEVADCVLPDGPLGKTAGRP